MGFEQPQVFISSTSELTPERQALSAAIREMVPPCHPFDYLTHSPRRASPKEECERQVRKSNVFLLLLGATYGSPFPEEPISIVEWEYEIAKKHRSADLQAYLKRFPPDADVAIDPQQEAFIARVRSFESGHWSAQATFTTPEELCDLALNGINAWRNEAWQMYAELADERARWRDRAFLTTASAVAIVTLLVVALLSLRGVPATSVGTVAGVGLLCMIFLAVFRKI